jgi:NAD(P)H-dependent flavin oxidoreductase YrpB (nitropropane dioxygenase family)
VMGTRFATSVESATADEAKRLILQTRDGGVSTKR